MLSDIDLVKIIGSFGLFSPELAKISHCQLHGGCSCPRTWSQLRAMEQSKGQGVSPGGVIKKMNLSSSISEKNKSLLSLGEKVVLCIRNEHIAAFLIGNCKMSGQKQLDFF